MKKTFKQVREFNQVSGVLLQKNPEMAQTKLGYAIKRLGETEIKRVLREYQEKYQEMHFNEMEKPAIDLALVDPATQAILLTPRGSDREYQYNKEGLIAVKKLEMNFQKLANNLMDEFDEKEFDIEPFYITDVPETLTEDEVEKFKGFVIEE